MLRNSGNDSLLAGFCLYVSPSKENTAVFGLACSVISRVHSQTETRWTMVNFLQVVVDEDHVKSRVQTSFVQTVSPSSMR